MTEKIRSFRELQEKALIMFKNFELTNAPKHPTLAISSCCMGIFNRNTPHAVVDYIDLTVDSRNPPGIAIDVVWGEVGTIEEEFHTEDFSEDSLSDAFLNLPRFLDLLLSCALKGGPETLASSRAQQL